ncbi:hypothetical protein Fmac_028625 [Flemingia macrophylla]|uniref:Uncharacterized protein n=1 Tax=Flemingia macrophylla TaxID=520843 RepID=A0ABD1L844_9FABA
MTTLVVYVLIPSNLEWMSILRLMLETPIADQLTSRDKALDREDGCQLLALRIKSLPLLQESAASVLPMTSLQQSRVDEHPEAYAANTYSKPPHNKRQARCSCEVGGLASCESEACSLLQEPAASVLPMTTILVSVLLCSNLEWMSILRLMLQKPIADHHNSRDKAIDREDGSQLLALERKLEALMNLVTQLAVNQKSASIARVCGIRFSNDHHTSVYPSSQQSGVDEHPEAYAANTYSRPPHQQRQGTYTPVETIKLEGKLDALVNLVTQLAVNQKLASVARVCEIRSSNDHHTSVWLSSWKSRVDEQSEAYAANTYCRHDSSRDKALDREDGSQLLAVQCKKPCHSANQKPASVARVCDICSSNDHHTSVCPSSQQFGFIARNDAIIIRGVHDLATDTSAETRKLEGKLDALVNFGTHLAVNQKPASVARVCGIHSSNDHHTSVCSSLQQSGVDEHPEAYAGNTYSRPPQQQRQGTS